MSTLRLVGAALLPWDKHGSACAETGRVAKAVIARTKRLAKTNGVETWCARIFIGTSRGGALRPRLCGDDASRSHWRPPNVVEVFWLPRMRGLSPQGVLRINWREVLFEEAALMTHRPARSVSENGHISMCGRQLRRKPALVGAKSLPSVHRWGKTDLERPGGTFEPFGWVAPLKCTRGARLGRASAPVPTLLSLYSRHCCANRIEAFGLVLSTSIIRKSCIAHTGLELLQPDTPRT
jgi:hypothetical protein